MVSEKTIFMCDICLTEYDSDEQRAIDCEASHADKTKLVIMDSKYKDFSVWPETIVVEEKKGDTLARFKIIKETIGMEL